MSSTCVDPTELGGVTDAVIIDVRNPHELAAGHVDGAINIPLSSLTDQVPEYPWDADIITVCAKGGGRSEQAASRLRGLGLTSARSLCGGTHAWMQLAAQGTSR